MSQREIRFNRIEIEITERREKVIRAHARNPYGSGWQIPLRDMTPNDLRKLADFMEVHGVGSDELGEIGGVFR